MRIFNLVAPALLALPLSLPMAGAPALADEVFSAPAYLGLPKLAIQGAARPGLGWLNVLVLLSFWNAVKFAWMAVLSLPLLLARMLSRRTKVGAPDLTVRT